MTLAKTLGTCPYCKEPIHPQATKCKHCQSELISAASRKPSFFSRYNTFRYGFLTGIVFMVVLMILTYLQFYRD